VKSIFASSYRWRMHIGTVLAIISFANNFLLSLIFTRESQRGLHSSPPAPRQASTSSSAPPSLSCRPNWAGCSTVVYQGDVATEPHEETKPGRIPIFYNLFVNTETDAPRVKALVEEQLSLIPPNANHPIYYNSIGFLMDIPNATLLQHHEKGSESVTLFAMWNYCKEHHNDNVIYMHSKGSFTSGAENDRLRRFLTRGVLSDECRNMPSTCNICSSRFSPLPHPHTSGNMFVARCDYIRKLVDPTRIRNKMSFIDRYPAERPWCKGRERFSLEHWSYSHPSNKVSSDET
jgi:hypothetical protein